MSRPITDNPYLADPVKLERVIRRSVLESTICEGVYHVTEEDLILPPPAPVVEPARKTA